MLSVNYAKCQVYELFMLGVVMLSFVAPAIGAYLRVEHLLQAFTIVRAIL